MDVPDGGPENHSDSGGIPGRYRTVWQYLVRIKESKRKGVISMKITQTLNGKELTLSLEGCLDTATTPELKQVLSEKMDGIDSLILDFATLEYISSAGLRALLTAHMTMETKGGMKILHVNEEVMDSMKITGMSDVLNLEND